MIGIIAAVGRNRELGKNNQLIWHYKADMELFKTRTLGHNVIMGRKTWESLPAKLKGRFNIVISRQTPEELVKPNGEKPDKIITDVESYIHEIEKGINLYWVIGGAQVYEQFLPYAAIVQLTRINAEDAEADAFFPNFDPHRFNSVTSRAEVEDGTMLVFNTYIDTTKTNGEVELLRAVIE